MLKITSVLRILSITGFPIWTHGFIVTVRRRRLGVILVFFVIIRITGMRLFGSMRRVLPIACGTVRTGGTSRSFALLCRRCCRIGVLIKTGGARWFFLLVVILIVADYDQLEILFKKQTKRHLK